MAEMNVLEKIRNMKKNDRITVGSIKTWAGNNIIKLNNNEDDWANQGWKIVETCEKEDTEKSINILVDVDCGTDDVLEPLTKNDGRPTDVVLNLQYFFMYYDQAIKVGEREDKQINVVLLIQYNEEDDFYRICCYLECIKEEKKNLCIVAINIDKEVEIDKKSIKKIDYSSQNINALLPLLHVADEKSKSLTVEWLNQSNTEYEKYIKNILDQDHLKLLLKKNHLEKLLKEKALKKFFEEKDLGKILEDKNLKGFFKENNMQGLSEENLIKVLVQTKLKELSEEKSIEDLLQGTSWEALLEVEKLRKILEEKGLKKLLEEISLRNFFEEKKSGYNHPNHQKKVLYLTGFYAINEIVEKTKNNYKEILNQMLTKKNGEKLLSHMPVLVQLMWLKCVQFYSDDEEIENDGLAITGGRNNKLDHILWDAMAYGEGIIQLLENSVIHSQHHTGYLSIYFHNIGLTRITRVREAANKRTRLYYKYRFNKSDKMLEISDKLCLEFNVTDMGRTDIEGGEGVLAQAKQDKKELKSLEQLFKGKYNDSPEQIAHHYGMPLFYNAVAVRGGRFICRTPHKDENKRSGVLEFKRGSRDNTDNEKIGEEYYEGENQSWTSYQILLSIPSEERYPKITISENRKLLDASYLKQYYEDNDSCSPLSIPMQEINIDDIITDGIKMDYKEGKQKAVSVVKGNLRKCIDSEKDDQTKEENRTRCIYILNMDEIMSWELEICLKGLFLVIAEDRKSQEDFPFLCRLVFKNEFVMCEALRRFAIFYIKSNENIYMKNTQLAFCLRDKDKSDVRFVLAGENLETAYLSARRYMQYHIDMQSGYLLSQINYLIADGKEKAVVPVELFPFDLVRPENKCDKLEENNSEEKNKSDFERKIEYLLQEDFQKKNFGCKINNAHIRMGSKIHVEDFYDAELLFQSIHNIYRFAYIIAEKVITRWKKQNKKEDDNKNVYLVGYENYSSILVQEVKALLEEAGVKKNIHRLQYVKNDEGKEKINSLEEKELDEDKKEKEETTEDVKKGAEGSKISVGENADFIFIVPIGTTLSTVYKIKNAFKNEKSIKICENNLHTIVMIVVGNSDAKNGEDYGTIQEGDVKAEYWTMGEGNHINLMPESAEESLKKSELSSKEKSSKNPKWKVDYLFMIFTKWMLPDHCEKCNWYSKEERKPKAIMYSLGQVDKTSTLPKQIYPLKRNTGSGEIRKIGHGIGFTIRDIKENLKIINWLNGYVEYGHISRASNHYQFYIDFDKFYNFFNVRETCKEWLSTLSKDIKPDEFYIVISPLQHDNSVFVKDVVDVLFHQNLRFIYISLDQAYREEVRTRFSYIAKEYKDACKGSATLKYNVYYVDHSIVSAQTARRAEMFVRMLLKDADVGSKLEFSMKMLLLINRSSYDTAAAIVKDPEEDYKAFCTVCIPSLNTQNNHCPACELVGKYKMIEKCSATNEMYWHFSALERKHQLTEINEHLEKRKKLEFLEKSSQKSFCLVLYHAMSEEKKEQANDETLKSALKRQYITLQNKRNWRRLYCTHQAMQIIEQAETVETRCFIDQIIAEIRGELEKQKTYFEKREWLFSYIKTFSREYPAKVMPFRNAIYTLLNRWFLILVRQEDIKDDVNDVAITKLLKIKDVDGDGSCCLQLYELFLTLSKRLCDMQSNLLMEFDTLQEVEQFINALRDEEERTKIKGKLQLLALPGKKEVQRDYMYLLKWAAMSSSEEAKAFLLQSLSERIMEQVPPESCVNVSDKELNGDGTDEKSTKKKKIKIIDRNLAEFIRLENTRLLYSGIKRLHEQYKPENNNPLSLDHLWQTGSICVDNAMKSIGWTDKDGEEKVKENIAAPTLMQNSLYDLFRFLYRDLKMELENADRHSAAERTDFVNAKLKLCREILTSLLGIYHLTGLLEKRSDREEMKDLLQIYSYICAYFAKLSGFKNCCIVHKSNNDYNVLVGSFSGEKNSTINGGLEVNEKIRDILRKRSDKIAEEVEKGDGDKDRTVTSVKGDDGNICALAILLRIRRLPHENYLQKIYIIAYDAVEDTARQDVNINNYLLFMRQSFQQAIRQDLYALQHFKTSREDVARLPMKDGSPKPAGLDLAILHITDLHVSTANKEKILISIKDNVAVLRASNPELMVVTGDIVQGNGTAVDLEENYKAASEVLYTLAQVLWNERFGDSYVMHYAWKKRILIIPGNHDYASMNELVANSALRVTTGGNPAQNDGSTMIKYSYYIQFLQDFLDIDTRKSIRDNLNFVAEYSLGDFKIRFLALNSVAEVGPMRNNKVQLDLGYINTLIADRLNSGYLNLCLVHHTLYYKADYFSDRYWAENFTEDLRSFTKRIIGMCCIAAESRKTVLHQKKCMEEYEKLKKTYEEELKKIRKYKEPDEKEKDKQKIIDCLMNLMDETNCTLGEEIRTYLCDRFKSDSDAYNEVIKDADNAVTKDEYNAVIKLVVLENQIDNLQENHHDRMETLLEKMKDTEISADIKYLIEHWREYNNERCRKIYDAFINNEEMSIIDQTEYALRFKKLNETYHVIAMLGGHTHADRIICNVSGVDPASGTGADPASGIKVDGLIKSAVDKGVPGLCVEGPMFRKTADPDTRLCFGVLTFMKGGGHNTTLLKYRFVPDKTKTGENHTFDVINALHEMKALGGV